MNPCSLTQCASEIMIIRTADNYNVEKQAVMLQDGSMADRGAFDVFYRPEANYVDPMFHWCHRLKGDLQCDMTEICLLACISLFKFETKSADSGSGDGDGGSGSCHRSDGGSDDVDPDSFCNILLTHFKKVLLAYINGRNLSIRDKFNRLMNEMTTLKAISALQNKMLHYFDKSRLPKLLREELWSQHLQSTE